MSSEATQARPLGGFEITEIAVPGGRIVAVEIEASSTAHQSLLDRRNYNVQVQH
jgi:hypothetical protein